MKISKSKADLCSTQNDVTADQIMSFSVILAQNYEPK